MGTTLSYGGLMEFLIFCADRGFYCGSGNWTFQKEDAARYTMSVSVEAECGDQNARLVDADLYTNETFEGVVDRFLESLEHDDDGECIARVASNFLCDPVAYEGDSLWTFGGEPQDWDALHAQLRPELLRVSREDLLEEYNDYCDNQVYLDDNEGFIHREVL